MKVKDIMMKVSNKYYSHYLKKDKWFWFFYVSFVSSLLFILIPPILGSAFRNIKVGEEVKTFVLKDLSGAEVNIETSKGKLIVLNFFQIDKDKSKDSLKSLQEIYKTFKDKGVAFFAITSDKALVEDIKKFKDENKIEFPILIDEEKTVYQTYGIFVMPVTALIDKDFKLVYEYSSYMSGFDSEVGGRIKVALGEMTMEEYTKSNEQTVIKERSTEEKSALKKMGQAKVLLARGRADEALKILKEVVALDPNIPESHILLGECLLKKGSFDEALTEYEAVKKMLKETDPVAKEADVGMGAIYAIKGELDKAKNILGSAAMINPNPLTSGKAYYWLGFISEKEKNLEEAVNNYKKAVEKLLEKSNRSR